MSLTLQKAFCYTARMVNTGQPGAYEVRGIECHLLWRGRCRMSLTVYRKQYPLKPEPLSYVKIPYVAGYKYGHTLGEFGFSSNYHQQVE
jgi:hypothetical protein